MEKKSPSQVALEPLRAAGSRLPSYVTSRKDWVASIRHEVEGVHFDPTFLSPYDLGRKTLAIACFELAASGVTPKLVQVASGVNQSTTEVFLDEVFRGMDKVADRFKIALRHGNSVHSPTSFFLSLLCMGEKKKRLLQPKIGDWLGVTGNVGAATAGLNCLRRYGWTAVKDYAEVVRAHLSPEPPLEAALAFSSVKGVALTASVDGIVSDVHRFCSQARVGALIEEKELPISKATREAAAYLNVNPRRWGLYGAEDFGLLVCVPPRKWKVVNARLKKMGSTLTRIGTIGPAAQGICMTNLENEKITLANRSWNPLVRQKAS